MRFITKPERLWALLAMLLVMPATALAEEAPQLNSGDTAWMLTATALVLFMTIPGLSLFYAGMVRSKNVLSVLMQCFAITSLMTILWMLYGYSLAFEDGGAMQKYVGGLSKAFLKGVGVDSLSLAEVDVVQQAAPEIQMMQLTEVIDEIRLVKSEQEVTYLRQANQMALTNHTRHYPKGL